jgi:hypothetical protein
VLAKRVLAKRVLAKRVVAKRVVAKRVVAKRVVAKPVLAKPLLAKRARRPGLGAIRRPTPVRRAGTTAAPSARTARSAVPARRVLRPRSRASVAGRAAETTAVPMAARITTAPVPVPEGAPALDDATVTTTPEPAS